MCFLAFFFLSKATDYFSHMLLQRWEAKIRRKKSRLNRGSNSQPAGNESGTLTKTINESTNEKTDTKLRENAVFSNLKALTYLDIIECCLTISQTRHGLYVCSTSLMKTLWEKKKLLVMSNFSFPTVFSTGFENIQPFS